VDEARPALLRLRAEGGVHQTQAAALLARLSSAASDGPVTGEQKDAVTHPGRTS
jgi:hypothetical protein